MSNTIVDDIALHAAQQAYERMMSVIDNALNDNSKDGSSNCYAALMMAQQALYLHGMSA